MAGLAEPNDVGRFNIADANKSKWREEKPMPEQKGHPLLSGGKISPKDKIVTAEEAVRLIRDGATVATGGFVGIGFPEAIAIQIEKHFLEYGRPRDLTLIYAAGQGNGKQSGLNHLG